MRVKAVAAIVVAALAGAIASGVSGGVGGSSQQMYYGVTSQGGQVTFVVEGNRIVPLGTNSYLLYTFRRAAGWLEFHPLGTTLVFHGGKLAWHTREKLGGGYGELWITARLTQGGDRMTGTFRVLNAAYGRPIDTGTLRWSATRWAAQTGVEWTGKTAAGQPLSLAIRYKLVPGHVILNGKRTQDPAFEVSAPAIATTLSCRDASGAAAAVPVTLPALAGQLYGRVDYPSFSRGLKSLGPAHATGTTPQEIALDASLVVDKLAWRSGGLAATGTLKVSAQPAGGGSCNAIDTGFTVHPR